MSGLIVVGGGLAGCEAAWQAARRGVEVTLFEMRPARLTEAHKTGLLGELVCSNSLRSADVLSAPGLLKRELEMADSVIMQAAAASRIPAGSAFAVDRGAFAEFLTETLSTCPLVTVIREEVSALRDSPAVVATGPLTSGPMADTLKRILGCEYLHFYDAIAPIVDAESIEYEKVYFGSRYGKGGDDYVNCPMTKAEYETFFAALCEADRVNVRAFENEKVFEGCMPVEVMAMRGKDTLRFGPMKPVGLPEPKTGREPYAVVQLRPENRERSSYNMVGFQTRLKWPEQKRVFSMIPGLQRAEFLRYGSVHRNTFVNTPQSLESDLTLKAHPSIFLAVQITGVEGYIESTAMGLVAGINASRRIKGERLVEVPLTTAHGCLIHHITSPSRNFQPSNIHFGLFPAVVAGITKRDLKRKAIVDRAISDWAHYIEKVRA